MESDLKEWKKTVNEKRSKCYSLNHFTMQQILNLRKELASVCTGQVAVDELPLQTFMLLETVNKNIDPLLLADVLRTIIADDSIFLTDDGFEDEDKYFTSDIQGESIAEKDVEIEVDVFQPAFHSQGMNSVETFLSAKEALEDMSMEVNLDDYLLAALQDCGHDATEDELVAWVVSHENDEETVLLSCEEAKKNPRLSDLVEEVFGLECQTGNDEEEFLNSTTEHER
jgi:hypothetical protein